MAVEKDDRLFAMFAIEMDEHPKIIGLSDGGFRALFEATFYARRLLTDGFLDERVVLRRWGQAAADELSSNDSEKPSWIRVERGWLIHDWEKHHPMRADIEARRADVSEKRRQAGSKGAAKRWQTDGKAMANDSPKTESETDTYKPPKPPTGGGTKGSRLNSDWVPTAADVKAISEQCPGFDSQREHLNFMDYWQSKPGRAGTKLNWSMTWRSWMRNAYDRLPASQKPTQTRKVRRFNDEDG